MLPIAKCCWFFDLKIKRPKCKNYGIKVKHHKGKEKEREGKEREGKGRVGTIPKIISAQEQISNIARFGATSSAENPA